MKWLVVVVVVGAGVAAWFFARGRTERPAAPSSSVATAAAGPAAPSSFDRARAGRTPNDLNLLAVVERVTGRSPSPDVLELLALAQGGADETALRSFIRERFRSSLAITHAAMDWLDARAGRALEPPMLGATPAVR